MSEPENWSEARLWLRYAREDLSAAEELLKATLTPRNVCFLAQQSAEKAIKAALIFDQIPFSRTHDLDAIAKLAPIEWVFSIEKPGLSVLSQWAVEARYPGNWPVQLMPKLGKPSELPKKSSISLQRIYLKEGFDYPMSNV